MAVGSPPTRESPVSINRVIVHHVVFVKKSSPVMAWIQIAFSRVLEASRAKR
jgi:hypothetical protein